MPIQVPFSRLAEAKLREALQDTPVVLLHGPRQSGKTTLAKKVGDELGRAYISFDDTVQVAAAEADPKGFIADIEGPVTLDEVQRVPSLFTSIKAAVDEDRQPGRFLLAGSTNVPLVPHLADSLAGRLEVLPLLPLSQCEIEGVPARLLSSLLATVPLARMPKTGYQRLGIKLAERIIAGGYPAALMHPKQSRRSSWYKNYVTAIIQRDVRSLANLASLDALPRLLQITAAQTAQLLNVAGLASPFQLSRPTIRDYVTLLEQVFLIDELPAWYVNRHKRLVKTRKVHLGDTGVAAALLGYGGKDLYGDREYYGQLLETFVLQELKRQASGSAVDVHFYHFRDRDGYEVDVVLESGPRKIVGIEVKASSTVVQRDFRGLRKLASSAPGFILGIVFYDGDAIVPFGEHMKAVPIAALWR